MKTFLLGLISLGSITSAFAGVYDCVGTDENRDSEGYIARFLALPDRLQFLYEDGEYSDYLDRRWRSGESSYEDAEYAATEPSKNGDYLITTRYFIPQKVAGSDRSLPGPFEVYLHETVISGSGEGKYETHIHAVCRAAARSR